MVIFNSYVKLPEGRMLQCWKTHGYGMDSLCQMCLCRAKAKASPPWVANTAPSHSSWHDTNRHDDMTHCGTRQHIEMWCGCYKHGIGRYRLCMVMYRSVFSMGFSHALPMFFNFTALLTAEIFLLLIWHVPDPHPAQPELSGSVVPAVAMHRPWHRWQGHATTAKCSTPQEKTIWTKWSKRMIYDDYYILHYDYYICLLFFWLYRLHVCNLI